MKSFDAVEAVYAKYVESRFPLPSEADIAALESKMGTKLPPLYREFLEKYNGGYFSDAPFELNDEGNLKDCVTTLWGIGTPQRKTDLANSLDIFDDNDPAIILPMGYTMMGNLLILELEEDVAEQLVLKYAGKQSYNYVADDIIQFMKMIEV